MNKGKAYGDLAERQAKIASKYDADLEKELVAWMSSVIGEEVPSGHFSETLKDGVVLVKLMNKLGGKAVPYRGTMAFKQMENIGNFLKWVPSYGVRPENVFQTADLFEGNNLSQVQVCILSVKRSKEAQDGGKSVETYQAKDSVFMKTGTAPVATKHKENKGANPAHYSSAGKGPTVNKASGDDGRYGDMAERKAKLDSKYDKALEDTLRKWIESTTGESIGDDFQAGLKSGVILCNLANKLKEGSVAKVNTSSMAFKQMENINAFNKAAESLGVRSDDLFQTVSLYEGENMTQVLLTLENLKRVTSS